MSKITFFTDKQKDEQVAALFSNFTSG